LCKRLDVPQRSLFTSDHELIRPLSEYQLSITSGEKK